MGEARKQPGLFRQDAYREELARYAAALGYVLEARGAPGDRRFRIRKDDVPITAFLSATAIESWLDGQARRKRIERWGR